GAHASETPGQRCSVAKNKAAAEQIVAKLKCYENATQRGMAVDSTCLANAEMKLVQAFARADAIGGCAVSKDGGTVEAVARSCGNQIVMRIPGLPCGTFLTGWGSSGSGNGQFSFPRSVAVDRNENVFVADGITGRIQKFDSTGTFLTAWSSGGTGVAVDASG